MPEHTGDEWAYEDYLDYRRLEEQSEEQRQVQPEPFVVYRRTCDRSVDPLGYEWVADLPGPGDVKLVSGSKSKLEAEVARLQRLFESEGASNECSM